MNKGMTDKSETIQIIYTETANFTILQLATHLKYNNIKPQPVILKNLKYFESKVALFPLGCPICPDLLNLGCNKYRECNTPEGYRILYSIVKSQTKNLVVVGAVLSQKQSIQNLLFNRVIAI